MTFSDRILELCKTYNEARAASMDSKMCDDARRFSAVEASTINYCLGTLGISCVRSEGYITAFEYVGGFHEVTS